MLEEIFKWTIIISGILYVIETLYFWFVRVKHRSLWFPYSTPSKEK